MGSMVMSNNKVHDTQQIDNNGSDRANLNTVKINNAPSCTNINNNNNSNSSSNNKNIEIPYKKQVQKQKQKQYDIQVIQVSNIALAIRNGQHTINVQLSLRCQSLPVVQAFGSSIDSMIVILKRQNDRTNNINQSIAHLHKTKNFVQIGRSQIIANCTNPKYIKTFIIPFNQQAEQQLEFRVYHIKSPKSQDLSQQQLVGIAWSKLDVLVDLQNNDLEIESVENIQQLSGNQNNNNTANMNKMKLHQSQGNSMNNYNTMKKYSNRALMKINCIEYDGGTSKYEIGLQLSNFTNYGRSEVYFVIQAWKFGEWVPIVRSQSKKPSRFRQIQVNINKFQGQDNSGIRIKIFQAEKQSQIGSTNQFSIGDIFSDQKMQTHRVQQSGFVIGTLYIYKWKKNIKDSFISYIVGGVRLHLILAVDFTNSNSNGNALYPNKKGNSSLHTLDQNGQNQYINAIRQIVGVLQYFSIHNQVAYYGFGAKLAPYYRSVSQCFALNGNYFNPNVQGGVQELIKLYKENLKKIKMHGPTKISQILELAIKYASQEEAMSSKSLTYYVLIIVTDGKINDYQDTVQLIIKASTLPLSILFIGVGDGDTQMPSKKNKSNEQNLFGILQKLDADYGQLKSQKSNKICERDIVDFIKINDYLHDSSKLSLARQTFAQIPNHFIDYMYRKGIKPSKQKKSLKAAKAQFISQKIKASSEKVKPYVASFLINQRKQMRKKLIALGFNSKDPILDKINIAANDLSYFIEKHSLQINRPSAQFLQKQQKHQNYHSETISSFEIKKLQRYLEERQKRNKQRTLQKLQKIQSNYYGYRLKLPKKPEPPRPLTPKKLFHPCLLCNNQQIGMLHMQCGHSSICCICYARDSNTRKRCAVCYHVNRKVLDISKQVQINTRNNNNNKLGIVDKNRTKMLSESSSDESL